MKVKVLVMFFLISFFSKKDVYSQITLSSTTINDYVARICGPGVAFSNVNLIGDPAAIASFTGGISGGLGSSMNSGVVMSTGVVNTSNALVGTAVKDGGNAGVSIPELTSIAGADTYDGIILEFDFIPITNQIAVNYQFGSEEYNWYVSSGYNDAFAFFISGPGISGFQNIALVPSTSVPVTINSINNGHAGWVFANACSSGPCTNCNYYNDNCSNTFNNAMNGFTTVLTAYQSVTPCETYHIRLMIADGGDNSLDSWVFIQEDGLFSVGNPPVSSSASSGAGSGMFPEGCSNAGLTFSIPAPLASDYVFTVSYSGTATPGVDYDVLPTTITIPAGSTSVTIPVVVHPDGMTEGNETIIVDFPASICESGTITINIVDEDPIVVTMSDDITVCNGEPISLSASSSGGFGTITYTWDNGVGTGNPVTLSSGGVYTVTAEDECGSTATGQVTVHVIAGVTPSVFSDTVVCGNAFQIPLEDIVANGTVTWSEQGGSGTFSNPNILNPVFTGVQGVSDYRLILTDECGQTASGTVTIISRPQISAPVVSCNLAEFNIVTNSANGGVWSVIENPETPFVEDTTLTFIYGDTIGGSTQNTAVRVSSHGTYTLYFRPDDACPDTSIVLNFPPYIFTEITDTTLCTGIVYELHAWEPPYAVNYLWSNSSTEKFITVTGPGEHTVTVSNACYTYSDTATISYMFCDIDAPNIIVLSSQSGNQIWYVNGAGITDFSCVIVNRWGNLIYKYTDLYGSWNGTDQTGNIVTEGVYFYTINAILEGGKEITKHGFIQVVH